MIVDKVRQGVRRVHDGDKRLSYHLLPDLVEFARRKVVSFSPKAVCSLAADCRCTFGGLGNFFFRPILFELGIEPGRLPICFGGQLELGGNLVPIWQKLGQDSSGGIPPR